MYQKRDSIFLTSSASARENNFSASLSEDGRACAAIAHKNSVNLIRFRDKTNQSAECFEICREGEKNLMENDAITQIKLIKCGLHSLIVVTTSKGLQIYQQDGFELIYSYTFHADENGVEVSAKGIAGLNDLLCVGSSSGLIFRFVIWNGEARRSKISFLNNKTLGIKFNRPIVDLCSNSRDVLASADDNGVISLWSSKGGGEDSYLMSETIFNGHNGFACTSLGVNERGTILCAAYGTGHIRIFDLVKKRLSVEISAHGRWITGLDITENGNILSTSEDSFCRVWNIEEENQFKIKQVFSFCVPNTMLVGGGFIDRKGTAFCVAGYDTNEVHCFSL